MSQKLHCKYQNLLSQLISVTFHVTIKKGNYNVVFGRDLLQVLGIEIDIQNNFLGWQDINIPMKPIDCKMKTHFTIQDS